METHSREEHTEKKHDCMGTILCMLSCKDGYQLGPTQNDGCQSCTCAKEQGKPTLIEQQDMIILVLTFTIVTHICFKNILTPVVILNKKIIKIKIYISPAQ